jgi:RNA polymerase sigma-70 factor (ECF subfamily)
MRDPQEERLQQAVSGGEESAFEEAYKVFAGRVRLAAWRISHRPDWLDEIVNEAWYRAFQKRTSYDPAKPFLHWMAGIVQNVYREQCRKSPLTLGSTGESEGENRLDTVTPAQLADEAETLAALNDCIGKLSPEDARLVRLRFFENKTLRDISEAVKVPESTLREARLPGVMDALRRCLGKKNIEISQIFPAQGGAEGQ